MQDLRGRAICSWLKTEMMVPEKHEREPLPRRAAVTQLVNTSCAAGGSVFRVVRVFRGLPIPNLDLSG